MAGVRFPDPDEVAALVRAAGGAPSPRREARFLSGYAIALALPRWLLAASGVSRRAALPPHAVLRDLELAQALLLLHLQELDDEVDGQRQGLGLGNSGHFMALARQRLRRAVGVAPPFWREFARLVREQGETSAWEVALRRRRSPGGEDELGRIAGRAALLRFPAAAVAHLVGKPALRARLDRLARRVLLVALLLDDLGDVVEDAELGSCNAVLLAGRPAPWGTLQFYAGVRRGTASVARWVDREIDAILRDSRGAPGAARACSELRTLAAWSASCVSRWASGASVSYALRAGLGMPRRYLRTTTGPRSP